MNTKRSTDFAARRLLLRVGRSGHAQGARGFTLIELVIVVAIVAILAAIALPSYRQYVLRANRAQGKADMLQAAQTLERQYTVNRDYNANTTICGQTIPSPATGTLKYNLSTVCVTTPAGFVITATPQGGQVGDPCGNLSLDQAGRKTYSAGTAANCAW